MEEGTHQEVLERRLLRLEERLDLLSGFGGDARRAVHPLWPFTLGGAALVAGYFGTGLPDHPYQVLFAALVLLVLYHRGPLRQQDGVWRWSQAAVNFCVLCMVFKLLLGAGIAHPLGWVKLPALVKNPPPEGGSWFGTVVPDMSVRWQAVPLLAGWSIDLTRAQTVLLIATLAGALFRFQPFASLTALVLLLVSLPSYLAFSWDAVVPFLVLGSAALYLQTGMAGAVHRP